jgi:hypothetical protein
MNQDHELREHVLYLLKGGGAHLDFEAAVANLPAELRGAKPGSLPHSPWRLLEHMRIAQWDILEFCRNPRHVSPHFPEGYWPAGDAPGDAGAWERSLAHSAPTSRPCRNWLLTQTPICLPTFPTAKARRSCAKLF